MIVFRLLHSGDHINLRKFHFDNLGILTLAFLFDSATTDQIPTLPMSVWTSVRGFKEFM